MIDAAFLKQTAPLYKSHAAAVAGRPQLKAAVQQIEAGLSQLPPTSPQVPAMKQQLTKLQKRLAGIDAFLKQWPSIVKKLKTAKATARATAGSAINTQIGKAQDKLDTAKTQLNNARDVLKIIRSGANVGVVLAEARRDQATIVAPNSGLITQAASANTVVIVGAPLFRIAPDAPTLVDTYLAADQLRRVGLGTVADITWDSAGGKTYIGTLVTIDPAAPYPPTSFPTDIVHMTHTVKVTFQLDSGANPPAGTPVDITIHAN